MTAPTPDAVAQARVEGAREALTRIEREMLLPRYAEDIRAFRDREYPATGEEPTRGECGVCKDARKIRVEADGMAAGYVACPVCCPAPPAVTEPTRDALHAETLAMLAEPILTAYGYSKQAAYAAECVRKRAELEAELDKWREREASVCPEDFGFEEVIKTLRAEVERLRGLLGELVDTGDCQYDHHGYCQAHKLDPRPCPNERAITLLALPAPCHYCRCKTCRAARRPTPRTDR